MKNKGKTKAKVKTLAQIIHLDSSSKLHELHQHYSKQAQHAISKLGQLVLTKFGKADYPSLGAGLLLKPDGTELTSKQHTDLLSDIQSSRGFYLQEYTRKGRTDQHGEKYVRERKTDPLHQVAVHFRPDYALAVMAQEKHLGIASRPLVKKWALHVSAAFSAATDYEPIAIQVHPREGCLHFHISYATVDQRNKLIHARGQRGRHGMRMLGPALIGALRLADMGLLPEDKKQEAERWLDDRRQHLMGRAPVDQRMAEVLDGLCSSYAATHPNSKVRKVFDDALADYKKQFRSGEMLSRDYLVERYQHLTNENAELRHKNTELAKQVVALEAKLPAPSYQKSAADWALKAAAKKQTTNPPTPKDTGLGGISPT